MSSLQQVDRAILIGIGATAVMDVWLFLLGRMGVATLNFAFIGRWVGHLFRGRFAHLSIGRAEPIPGELAWGWIAHYAIGIAFAGLLLAVQGFAWARHPALGPSVLLGVSTALVPLCVIQPAMGAGYASSKTPTPIRNSLRSLANHTVFGVGLYLSAAVVALSSR